MSIETRIKAIKEAQSESEVVAAYGDFVEYYERLSGKASDGIKARPGDRGWTRQRRIAHDIKLTPSEAQEAIAKRFGFDVMHKAIAVYPFS